MISVLSLETVKAYPFLFRLSMRCVAFELTGRGTYVPPSQPCEGGSGLRPPAVRGLKWLSHLNISFELR